jgi:hypothetical protein
MAPIQNAALIACLGVMSYNSVNRDPSLSALSRSIADPFVNDRRRYVHGIDLHDYVPLYWASHTPMQYVVTRRDKILEQSELIFFRFQTNEILSLPGILTTDGNAASGSTSIHQGTGALDSIDWKIVSTNDCYSTEYKRKKCAEVLVPNAIRPDLIASICVYLPPVQARLAAEIQLLSEKLKIRKPSLAIEWVPAYFYY